MRSKRNRLYRSRNQRILGGVCGGLAKLWGCNPMWTRLLFIVWFLLATLGLWAYIIMWIIVPLDSNESQKPKRRRPHVSQTKPVAKK